ncbi:MAG TPA: UPF0182 family protein [Deltaproteobacteria bacterium]|nr:UPF0182 family protein [Deltaproteobacteria bacterium]
MQKDGPNGFNKNLFKNFPGDQIPQFRIDTLDFRRMSNRLKLLGAGLAVLILIALIHGGVSLYRDWLWFGNLGYEPVLMKVVYTRIWLFLVGSALALLLVVPNMLTVLRDIPMSLPGNGTTIPPEAYTVGRRLLVRVGWGITILGALFFAVKLAAEWETVLCYFNGVLFDKADPIFHKDFSFYIFTLPALEMMRSWLLSLTTIIIFIVAALYFVAALLRGERVVLEGRMRSHLLVLASFYLVLVAGGYWLGRYELLYSPTGAVFGVGFTDDHFTLPARAFLAFAAVVCAAMLLAGLRFMGNRPLLFSVGALAVLHVLTVSIIPAMIQRLYVEPSELARESSYLTNNIELTREAYNLTKLQSRSHPALGAIDNKTLAENPGTIRNVRLWDEGPLLQSYNQIQFFRLYYDFLMVHTDRYRIGDELRQVMLATRELSAEKLPAEAQRWVNRHLQFTHGYGAAMTPVTEVDQGGRPGFFLRDVPPKGNIPLDRPEIYYGLKSLPYLIVKSGMQEFNYPGSEGPVYTRYEGTGGVLLSSIFRRIVYAFMFMDLNILISGEILPESRIQYRRTVPERISAITPFLLRDREAYSVVADGRLFWIQDAYTYTKRYPYSTPWQNRFNYMRNSVKAVIDAYHGTIEYYVSDPSDPIIRTYQSIFPDLFKPMADMPPYLRDHARYPLDLFTVQTQMLLQYHMEDPTVFYNKEDQWSIPVQSSFGKTEALRPYYIVARLPGEAKEEFLLIQPFTPASRHNLVGWMAARNDGNAYGELVLFRFPTGRHVDGPNQIEARIDNDAVISEQFTLWGQVGSEVFRGILLVIPIGDALLYAEPVFLKPETLDFPELRRIILADSRQVVMHQTLDAATAALVGALPAVALETEDVGAPKKDMGFIPAALDDIRKSLQDAVKKLQEIMNTLQETTP